MCARVCMCVCACARARVCMCVCVIQVVCWAHCSRDWFVIVVYLFFYFYHPSINVSFLFSCTARRTLVYIKGSRFKSNPLLLVVVSIP